jgi:mono/diheme cytochrome c family protein
MLRRACDIGVLLVVTGVLARGIQVRDRDAEWTAPANAAGKVNPLAGRSDTVTGGRKLFQQRCATCHGDDGRGSPRAPDLTVPTVQGQTDGALFWKVSSGNTRQGMPSFSFLPELQRWQLVQSVRSMP